MSLECFLRGFAMSLCCDCEQHLICWATYLRDKNLITCERKHTRIYTCTHTHTLAHTHIHTRKPSYKLTNTQTYKQRHIDTSTRMHTQESTSENNTTIKSHVRYEGDYCCGTTLTNKITRTYNTHADMNTLVH